MDQEHNTEQAEDAIEHMVFLTDANRLYSHALGLYDLELTLLVAQQAQMVSFSLVTLMVFANHLSGSSRVLTISP